MDTKEFQAKYPSANIVDKNITLSEDDYLQLLRDIDTSSPENVRSFFYHGYLVEKATSTPTKAKG